MSYLQFHNTLDITQKRDRYYIYQFFTDLGNLTFYKEKVTLWDSIKMIVKSDASRQEYKVKVNEEFADWVRRHNAAS